MAPSFTTVRDRTSARYRWGSDLGKERLPVLFSFWFAPRDEERALASGFANQCARVTESYIVERPCPAGGRRSALRAGAAGSSRRGAHAPERPLQRRALDRRRPAGTDHVEPPLERHRDQLRVVSLGAQEAVAGGERGGDGEGERDSHHPGRAAAGGAGRTHAPGAARAGGAAPPMPTTPAITALSRFTPASSRTTEAASPTG